MQKRTIKIISILTAAALLFSTTVWALPQNGTAAAGASNIAGTAKTLTINQTTDKAIINWQSYSIGVGEKVRYVQPGAGSLSLNRVTGADPSLIYGQLSANGQVWVINPNGLLVGSGAAINVGSFLGSTLNIQDEDFLKGNYKFSQSGSLTSIVNQGGITTPDGGYVVLISPTITNEGTITANLGKAYLASGNEVNLTFAGNDLIGFTVDKETAAEALGITNKGTIAASGGEVILSAQAASDLVKTVIRNEGVIEAKTIAEKEGKILLLGGMEKNAVEVSGTLDASAPDGGNGGFIETSAAKVKISDSARITTAAPDGKTGTWLIDPTSYTIAATGGDETGAALSGRLGSTNITIDTTGAGAGSGDILVNDTVTWSANTLTLNAYRNIAINSTLYGSGTAGLALYYGQGASDGVISGTTATYSINAPVNLASTGSFATQLGSNTANLIPYTIITSLGSAGSTTGTDLQGMQGLLARNYVLGSNIDASATATWNSNAGFAPVGTFTGIFDGLGHTIAGLTIKRSNYAGLLGYADSGAAIRNVGLVGGSVHGNRYVGGLVGWNTGTITNSYSTGSVSSLSLAVGGLVGCNTGTITNSYSTGSVMGSTCVGGLVGYNGGTVTNSYWDTDTSGNTSSDGGTGLTTAQMKQSANFSGWDFTGVWRIYDGYSYPLLRSFLTPLTVTANNYSRSYDASAYSGGSVTYSLTPSALLLGSLTYGGTSQNVKNAGTYTITAAGLYSTSQQGYDITYVSGALTINPVLLAISGSSAANKVYDSTTAATVTAGTLSGLIAGETLSVSGNGTFDTKNVGTGKTVAATYALANGSGLAANYTLASENLTADISKANLAVTGLTVSNKIYDTTTSATLSGTATVTKLGTDDITLGGTASGVFADKNVGNGKVVTVTGNTLSGTDVGNYNFVQQTGLTADITPASLTVTANDYSRSYNGSSYSGGNGASYSGFVGGETTTVLSGVLSYGGSSQGAKNAGSYVLTPGGFISGNYSISYINGSLTITPKTLTIAGSSAASKVYDGTVGAAVTTGTLSGLVSTETLGVSGAGTFDTKTAGTGKTVAATYALANGSGLAVNYTLAAENLTADITPKTLTVSGITAANKTYNGTTAATVNGVLTGVVSGDTVNLGNSTANFSDKNVGTGKTVNVTGISLGGADGGNYTLATATATTTADITPATLTITGSSAANKVYDGTTAATVTAGTLSGLVGTETLGVSGSGTFDTKNVGIGKNVAATYTLADGSGLAGNYRLASESLSADITAKNLSVSGITVANKSYDGTTTATVSGAIAGVVSGDTVTLGNLAASFSDKNVGTGKTVNVTGISLGGADAGNYTLTAAPVTTTADITPAALTITANDYTRSYNATAYSGGNGVTYAGFVGGENSAVLSGTLAYTGSSQGAVNPGRYVIQPGGLASANYDISYSNGTLKIGSTTAPSSFKLLSGLNRGVTVDFPGKNVTEESPLFTIDPSVYAARD